MLGFWEKPSHVTFVRPESQRGHQGLGNVSQCGAEPCCMADLLQPKERKPALACEQRKSK